jgi:hypothetical protein
MGPSLRLEEDALTAVSDVDAPVASIRFSADGEVHLAGSSSEAPLRLRNVAAPLASFDAVNKLYVDGLIRGLTFKQPVRALADGPARLAPGDTVDGVQLRAGDRVLAIAQDTTLHNGIYVVGSPAQRAPDLADASAAAGVYVLVTEGATYRDRSYVCVNDTGSDTVGAHQLLFKPFGARPDDLAGTGLQFASGNRLQVDSGVVAMLQQHNRFLAPMTVEGPVRITHNAPATSLQDGALMVTGGVAVDGEVFCRRVLTLSDARVKRNVRALPRALEAVCALKGYEFEWRDRPSQRPTPGLMAQDVMRTIPAAVHHNHGTDTLAVDYAALVPWPAGDTPSCVACPPPPASD